MNAGEVWHRHGIMPSTSWRLLLPLLLPLAAASAPETRKKIAVIELQNPANLSDQEVSYITDLARGAALRLPSAEYFVMTRENVLEQLPPGVDLAACVGECEVETGRNVGADYVMSGEVIRFGESLRVSMKLHDTRDGALLGTERASGARVDVLEEPVVQAATRLFAPLARGEAAKTAVTGGVVRTGGVVDRGESIQNTLVDDTGFLTVETQPPGARITVNGNEVGAAPVQLEKMVGRYVVVADHGVLYHPARQALKLGSEGATVELKLLPRFGTLSVSSEPAGAEVRLEGERVGQTPWTDPRRRSGTYALRVVQPRYLVFEQSVTVRDGETTPVVAKLVPNFGGLRIESEPPGAEVWLDGKRVGQTPWSDGRHRLGTYELRVVRPLYLIAEQKVTVRSTDTTHVVAKLVPNFGSLRAETEPPGASIHLDGQATPHTTPHLFEQLQAGTHTLAFERAGYGRVTARTNVERGRRALVRERLEAKLGLLSVLATDADGRPCRGPVEVDGERKGDAPLKLKLVEGTHRVRITCASGSGETEIEVRHNKKATVTVKVGGAAGVEWVARSSGEAEVEVRHNKKAAVTVKVGGAAGVEWVRIPGGSFRMGSNEQSDEKPVHEVRVKTFELAKSEVTVGQYGACVKAGKCTAPDTGEYCNWGKSGREQHPVNCVDWNQARAFSVWVGGRLPTEAEWEYAARSGGKARKYPWGNEKATCARAVMNDGGRGCGRRSTWPVCSKPKGNSAQSVCDLAGNVWEWVEDVYAESYAGAPTDGSARTGGWSYRVFRGGCWYNTAGVLRAAFRRWNPAGLRNYFLGFRPARSNH